MELCMVNNLLLNVTTVVFSGVTETLSAASVQRLQRVTKPPPPVVSVVAVTDYPLESSAALVSGYRG